MVFALTYLWIGSLPSFIILNSLLHMNNSWLSHLIRIKEPRMFSIHAGGEDASTSSSGSFAVQSHHFLLTSLNHVQISRIHLINITLTVVQGSVHRWLFYHVFVGLQLLHGLDGHASVHFRIWFGTFRVVFGFFTFVLVVSSCINLFAATVDCLDWAHLTLVLSTELLDAAF